MNVGINQWFCWQENIGGHIWKCRLCFPCYFLIDCVARKQDISQEIQLQSSKQFQSNLPIINRMSYFTKNVYNFQVCMYGGTGCCFEQIFTYQRQWWLTKKEMKRDVCIKKRFFLPLNLKLKSKVPCSLSHKVFFLFLIYSLIPENLA